MIRLIDESQILEVSLIVLKLEHLEISLIFCILLNKDFNKLDIHNCKDTIAYTDLKIGDNN